MAAISLRDSFSQSLPPYPYTGGFHPVHDVGTTAGLTFPPKFCIHRASTGSLRWAQIGQQYLQPRHQMNQTYDIQTALSALQNAANAGQVHPSVQPVVQAAITAADLFVRRARFIPQTEANIRHTNEADVVRSANLYLIHPVIQALWSHPSYHQTLVSQSEDWKLNTQTDITFKKTGPIQPNSTQVHRSFFVMEYKRRGMIEPGYFQHTVPLPNNAQFTNQQAFYAHILTPVAPGQRPTPAQLAAVQSVQAPLLQGSNPTAARSMFTVNPIKLMIQAATYAIYHRTQYVALFNYDYLICCYFPWVDPTSTMKDLKDMNTLLNGEYPVEVDIYPGNSPDLRHALLGFMWTAIENTPF